MYNLVKAAEAGHSGTVKEAREYLLVSNLHLEAEVSARAGMNGQEPRNANAGIAAARA